MILSIVIVTYNHETEIQSCLDSLLAHLTLRPVQIIVVDNRSTDRTPSIIQKYRSKFIAASVPLILLQNPYNLGFTRGVNQALEKSEGKFVLLLNPDTRVSGGSVESLVQFLSNHPGVGAVAPQLRHPNGEIQPSCRRFPRYRYLLFEALGLSRVFGHSRFFNGWKMGDFDHRSPREVDQPQGSCLLLRGDILKEVGFLDERFFLFFSDVDLCRRIRTAGYRIFFYPSIQITHEKGSSIYRQRRRMIWQSHQDFARYFLKWYRSPLQWLWNLGGIPFLFLLGIIRWSWAAVKERA